MLKPFFSTASICSVLVLSRPVKAELKYPLVDQWTQRPISPPASILTIDEEFVALAKEASANIFVDASQIPVNQQIPPRAKAGAIEGLTSTEPLSIFLRDFRRSGILSCDRTDTDTLVFWHQPDFNGLIDLICKHQNQMGLKDPPADQSTTISSLENFFAQNYGWKAKAQTVADMNERALGVDSTIPLTALPPDIQKIFYAEFCNQIRHIDSTPGYESFAPSFWKDALFTLEKGPRNKRDESGRIVDDEPSTFLKLSVANSKGIQLVIGFPQYLPAATISRDSKGLKALSKTLSPKDQKALAILPNPISPVTPAFSKPEIPVQNLEIEENVELQHPVSFPVKRQKLSDFVSQLKIMSGVNLRLAADSFVNTEIIAGSAGMKLGAAMQAIERLYLAHWTKKGNAYALESDQPDAVHLAMAQCGISAYYTSRIGFMPERQRSESGDQIADEVIASFEPEQMQSKEGVPFSGLPAELQQRILELYRNDKCSSLIVSQQRLDDGLAQKINFRFAPMNPGIQNFFGRFLTPAGSMNGPLSYGSAAIAAFDEQGKFLCEMFPQFKASKPSDAVIFAFNARQEFGKQSIGLNEQKTNH